MKFKDYYDTLGVSRKATQNEIQSAYRKLARKLHPDVSKESDAESRFKQLGEAYEALKDSEKRSAYDRLGANWKAGQDFQPPADWHHGFDFEGESGLGADQAAGFSDFFASLFGGQFEQRGHDPFGGYTDTSQASGGFNTRGQDIQAQVSIDVKDAYEGATRSLTLQSRERGPDGRARHTERVINVRIPKGVYQGQRIRLAGQAGPSVPGGGAGDLYLEVRFRPDPIYTVEGKNVHLDLPVAPWEAALGSTVSAPTPTGPIELKIPAGSPAGRIMRLKGRGIPAKQPGDLLAKIEIVLPPAKGVAARSAYQALADASSFNPRERLGV